MLSVKEQYTQFNIRSSDGNSGQALPGHGVANAKYFSTVEIGWIPEGFECTKSSDRLAKFENAQGEYIIIFVISAEGGPMKVDTENPESLEYITINGNKGICTVKYGEVTITLADLKNNLYLGVDTSSGLSVETAKKIAENITIL